VKVVTGGTVIDGTGAAPITDAVVVVDGDRVRSVTRAAEGVLPQDAEVVDATGRYVIPGLIDANVHLCVLPPDLLLEYEGRYAEPIEEAAQVTLRAGVTTVFDTWGPLEPLRTVRDRIRRGQAVGSRIFLAGNIIGLGGPLSSDFWPPGDLLGQDTLDRINRQWEQGVGQDLLWLTPEDVRRRVRTYVERSGIDFVKYAASGHKSSEMRLITFSERTQRAIVEEAHRAGLTVQAHTTSVESLRMEIEAGADILQHGDFTGLAPMPDETLTHIVDRALPVAAIVCTARFQASVERHGSELMRTLLHSKIKDDNDRRLIERGARLLLTTDGWLFGPRLRAHPSIAANWKGLEDHPSRLGESHFLWLQAVVEHGMAPMDALLSATRNVAEAYGQAAELGTIEPGKRADLVILDADPLADTRNYRSIAGVMKDGVLVDRGALPVRPDMTAETTT
jgi:imidazolonepropionase-like amidohydrolase